MEEGDSLPLELSEDDDECVILSDLFDGDTCDPTADDSTDHITNPKPLSMDEFFDKLDAEYPEQDYGGFNVKQFQLLYNAVKYGYKQSYINR